MIDVNKLDRVGDLHIYVSSLKLLERKYTDFFENYENIQDEIVIHELKDHEEVTGTLMLISIDPKDPTLGYCFMEVGDQLTKVRIYDPKKVFKRWDKDKEIIFSEKVSVARFDTEGIPNFHLRYHSDTFKVRSKEITKYITDYINGTPSEEEIKKRKEEESSMGRSKYPKLKYPLPSDDQ